MGKVGPAAWVIGAVVVLLGAYGLGLGIRAVRSWRAEAQPKVESKQQTQLIDAVPASGIAEPEGPQMAAVEEQYVMVEEPVEEPVKEADEDLKEEPDDMAEAEPEEYEPQGTGGFGDWRQIWADLNLTEEEQARLREGFRLAMERWQNMSEEERQAEMERMRAGWERWQNMSDEEREESMQRMRDRFEEWRRSDRVELPEFSLD